MSRPSKREAILKTAGELFITHGFRKVSIDQIVEAVPISKPTLYAHFKDKRALYNAVIEARCGRLLSTVHASVALGHPVEETLIHIGDEFLRLVLSQSSIDMHRILASEAVEFPKSAALFFNSGPSQMHATISAYLADLHQRNILDVPDATLSTEMFFGMLKGLPYTKALLGICKLPSRKQQQERVRYAVRLFMKAHALT